MKRGISVMMLAFSSCSPSQQASPTPTPEASARALDGDTVSVDFRLLGVDAFERKQLCQRENGCWQCGKAGQDLSAHFLRDQSAQISITAKSTYGRPVATVSVNGSDLGETLILAGLAVPETKYLGQDPDRASRYEAAYQTARVKRAGALAGKWIKPSEWRHGARLECER